MKEELCRKLVNDKSLNSLAYRLAGEDKKDLIQELALIICEKEDKELKKIAEYFSFWCVRVMINMTGARGNFTKKYSNAYINYEDAIFDYKQEYDADLDVVIDAIEDILDGMKWYKRDLFKLYLECGSFRKVEKEVGIDHSSVYLTVKEVKQTIKDKL